MKYGELRDINKDELYKKIERVICKGVLMHLNYRYMHNNNRDKHVCVENIIIIKDDDSDIFFRDHCFIKVDKNMEKIIAKLSKRKPAKYNIEFDGDIFLYLGSNGKKYGIRKLKNIKIINKEKK